MNRFLSCFIFILFITNCVISKTISDNYTNFNHTNNHIGLVNDNNLYDSGLLNGDLFQIDDSLLSVHAPEMCIKPAPQFNQPNLVFYFDEKIYYTPNDSSKSNFLVITTPELWCSLQKEIKTYAEDIHAIFGYGVYIDVVSTNSPEQLKSVILNHQNNLSGVVLIGDFVACMYEINNDHNKYGYKRWPCDLYYMDLDGVWIDSDSNGTYDEHTGNVAPDIYMARLSTQGLASLGNESFLINRQLEKSHSFWWDSSFFKQDTSLNYINKDWIYSSPASHLAPVFSTNEVDDIKSGIDTCFSKEDYLLRISQPQYGFTYLAAHSSHVIHQFPNGNLNVSQIMNIPSYNYAYNLFCCSSLNWLATNMYNAYLGGAYLFNDCKTLTVIGSTKTGSMQGRNHFYSQFGQKNIGEAFLYWWNHCYPTNYHSIYTVSWSYGMTILGDPTIHFRHDVHNYCVNDLVLTSFPQNNHSNHILFKAGHRIKVTNKFVIPAGVHIVFDAPTIVFEDGFICPKGATFETRNEGCKL